MNAVNLYSEYRMKIIPKLSNFKLALLVMAFLFTAIMVDLCSNVRSYGDCSWDVKAYAWLDQNQNGIRDMGESPLQFVEFLVDDTRHEYRGVNSNAVSDRYGIANVNVWMPGCPRVSLKIYAQPPPGYQQIGTESYEAKGVGGEGPYYFAFTLSPNSLTPTPRPVSELTCQEVGSSSQPVWGFVIAPDSSVWVLGYSVQRFDSDGNQQELPVHIPAKNGVGALAFGENGEIWVGNGALAEGLFWFDGNQWKYFTTEDGLSDNEINDIALGENGTVWIATNNGITRFIPETGNWSTYSFFPDDQRVANSFKKIIFAPDNSIWLLESYHAIVRLIPNGDDYLKEIVVQKDDSTAPLYNYNNALLDNSSGLWLDSYWAVARFDTQKLHWEIYNSDTTNGALPPIGIWDMTIDRSERIWLGTYQHGVVYFEPPKSSSQNGIWTFYQDDRIISDYPVILSAHPDGAVWMAADGNIFRCIFPHE